MDRAIEKFGAARRASGMTADDASTSCGISRYTYQLREINPGDFRLSELRSLHSRLSDTARPILDDAVSLFICGDDSVIRNRDN